MRDYQTKSNVGGVADSISATRFGGGEFNSIAVELENAVESSDQTLAPADGTGEVSNQLAMALAIYGAGGAQYCIDTGAVNAYVIDPVSPKEGAPDYFDGLTLSFEPGTANTGASTVNYNSLGVKNIKNMDGSDPIADEIATDTLIRYDDSAGYFKIIPASICNINSLSTSGYIIFTPDKSGNRLIMQWGVAGGSPAIGTPVTTSFNYPITFPNQVLSVQATHIDSANTTVTYEFVGAQISPTTSAADIYFGRTSGSGAMQARVLVIGY